MTSTRHHSSMTSRVRNGLTSTSIVYLVLAVVLVLSVVVAAAAGHSFVTGGNLTTILTSTTVLGFIAIGQTCVILAGSLDLSVPFVVSLSSVLGAATMAGASGNLVSGVLVALITSTVLGIVNGLLVGVVKVTGFIATLGVGLMVSGYLYTYYQGSTGQASPQLSALGDAQIGPVPVVTVVMVACLTVAALLLAKTRTGSHVYAVGGDEAVARMSGIRAATPVIVAHAISGLLSGLAGLILVARLGVGSPTLGSQGGYDLLSIAAVVLGGVALAGGRGSVWGTLGGILILASLDSLLGILQMNPYLNQVVRGVVIILAVAVYARRRHRTTRPRFAVVKEASAL